MMNFKIGVSSREYSYSYFLEYLKYSRSKVHLQLCVRYYCLLIVCRAVKKSFVTDLSSEFRNAQKWLSR